MHVKIVDVAQWNKGKMFERYQKLGKYPIISCSVEVDVTRIHEAARRERTSFWLMFIHAIGQTINHFEAFRHRVVLDQVLLFDHIKVRLATLDKAHRYYFHAPTLDRLPNGVESGLQSREATHGGTTHGGTRNTHASKLFCPEYPPAGSSFRFRHELYQPGGADGHPLPLCKQARGGLEGKMDAHPIYSV